VTADAPSTTVTMPDGRTVVCTAPAEAATLWREIYADDCYGRAAAQIRPGDVVLDIGANIGLAALRFAAAAPDVQVISVEPAPATFACLVANVSVAGADVTPVCAAVMATAGSTAFTYYPNAPGNSSAFADPERDDATTRTYLRNLGIDDDYAAELLSELHSAHRMTVAAVTVADLLAPFPDRDVGVLKIDVEGAEMEVMRGLTADEWRRVRYVVAEVHDVDGRVAEVRSLLSSVGLSVAVAQDEMLEGTGIYLVDATRADA
jgi:FkbM family methyltransferase